MTGRIILKYPLGPPPEILLCRCPRALDGGKERLQYKVDWEGPSAGQVEGEETVRYVALQCGERIPALQVGKIDLTVWC